MRDTSDSRPLFWQVLAVLALLTLGALQVSRAQEPRLASKHVTPAAAALPSRGTSSSLVFCPLRLQTVRRSTDLETGRG